MKWLGLVLIGTLLVIFWPQGENEFSEKGPSFSMVKASQSSRPANSTRRSRSEGISRKSNEGLYQLASDLWPKIMDDLSGRDPSVVAFIRTLRELGKRDGSDALDFLDDLDRSENESAWIRARVAVTGGWAVKEPEEAALALLEKDRVLPADFQTITTRSGFGSGDPAHLAIVRAASQIFHRWAEQSPDRAKEVALEVVKLGPAWNFGIIGQLAAATSSDEEIASSTNVQRSSIDAILNNPLRTAPDFRVGTFQTPTREMEDLGEPAFTQGEWAARNPHHALALIKEAVETGGQFYPEVLWGLAREDSNYVELLELAPPEHRMRTATALVNQSGNVNEELIWHLDGSETTWSLTPEERHRAALVLLENGNFSDKEAATLSVFLERAKIRPPLAPPIVILNRGD